MITCRQCEKEFPKPTTRGRPPVKCADCRGVSNQNVGCSTTKRPPQVSGPTVTAKVEVNGGRYAAPALKSKNGLYSRHALIEYLDANPGPHKPQELAAVIRSLSGDSVS